MPNIKTLDIDDHDIRNGFYSWSGTVPALKGTLVKISSGWSQDSELAELGSPGASYDNVVSQRVGLNTRVAQITASGDNVYGMLLYDVRELDENGLPLKWDARKQSQMQCTLSGQSVVLAKRGQFLYSGVVGTPTAGAPAYAHGDGTINVLGADAVAPAKQVGQFGGIKDANGWVLLDLDIR